MATSRTHNASEVYTNDDDDDGRIIDELPLELQPQFTEQDEQRELATMVIQELTELQSDLTGIQTITSGISGLGLGLDSGGMSGGTSEINVYGGESTAGPDSPPPAPLSMDDCSRLAALDQHMMVLPAQSTAAYFRATAECPDEVSNERKLLFLQSEKNSVPLAAQRLALYWQYRLDGFGEDRCFEPMTLAGTMRDEAVNMVKSGLFQLMPNTDAAGRAIIFYRFGKRDFSQFSVKQEVAWLSYLLEIVVQHKSLQSRGFVLLVDASIGTREHYSRKPSKYLQRALDGAFPIRMCSHHVCNANPFVTRVIFPVFQRIRSKKMRQRTRLHRGSGEDLLRSLATFNLPRDRLPTDIGRSVVLDIKQFVLDRLSLEASCAGINLPPAEEQSSPDDAGIVGKRQRVSETNTENQTDRSTSSSGRSLSSSQARCRGREQAPPIDAPSSEAAAAAASHSTKTSSKRRKGPRNIVDPRMARAVRGKQDDPDLSLYDALTFGGFKFARKGSGTTDTNVFDEDGVSLKQRKNNLCRRLREDRRKKKELESKSSSGGPTSVTRSSDSTAMAQSDSFDEEIVGLPGLGGLDDADLDEAFFDEDDLDY